MFCENCGNKINDSSKFCPTCGNKTTQKNIVEPKSESIKKLARRSKIKCLNCGYIGEGLNGRSKWASISALLLIPFAPIVPIIYFLVTHKFICPKCKSKFIEETDQEGNVIKSRNILLILLLILFAVAFIGILSSIVLVSMGGARAKARDAVRQSDLRQIAIAMELFYGDMDKYPTSSLMITGIEPYLPSFPLDPKTNLSYGWEDNYYIDDQKYCIYALMENKGECTDERYFTASHKGVAEVCSAPYLYFTLDCP